ncbi:hypothetical protein ABBQ32_002915 [Trebouxia sp. C0010 RCD-2024]
MYKQINAREPYNNILATPDYQEWKYFRKVTNPAFSPENIRKAFPKIYAAAVKATDVLHKMSSKVALGALFDLPMGALDHSVEDNGSIKFSEQPFLKNFKQNQDDMTMAFTNNPLHALMLQIFPWLPQAREVKAVSSSIREYEDHLAEVIRRRGKQPDSDTSVWACLGRLVNYKDGSPLPMPTLAALFELAADSNLQDRVCQELAAAGLVPAPNHPPIRHLDFSDLSKLKLLETVVRETLRVHATIPLGAAREVEQDMVIKGYRIPKGTPLMLPPHAMQLCPDNFSRPNKFWPDRWTSGVLEDWDPIGSAYPDATPAGNQRNLSASWNPFSTGPRNCIGQALALAELRTVLAVLLANFFFELPEGIQREKFIEEEEVWWITLQTKHGVHLKVTPVMGERKKKLGFVPKSDSPSGDSEACQGN